MKRLILYLLVFNVLSSCQSDGLPTVISTPPKPDTVMLDQAYQLYKESTIRHRRFKHADIEKLMLAHRDSGVLQVTEIGRSVLDKPIYEAVYGEGPKKIMLWSQMHGNEPTATMALMDLFNFLSGKNDGLDTVRNLLFKQTTLHFIPMLNPDGADRYTRRNAQDIDLNRDARTGATVEGKLLIEAAERIGPAYGFNLHDQNIYYNVPGTSTPVTIALLAPAFNEEREINDVRGKAMKIAVGMNRLLQELIPGAVGRYDDTFTPRGFGDNFQLWGASTVLVESGGYHGDPEKQYIRELNFKLILNALLEIAGGGYDKHLIHEYEQIPVSDSKLFDLLLRQVNIAYSDSASYQIDLGINRDEYTLDTTYYVRSRMADMGDLMDHYGYDELDASGLEFVPGQVYKRIFNSVAQLDGVQALELLRQGFNAVQVSRLPETSAELHALPLIVFNQRQPYLDRPALGQEANFFLALEGKLLYAVVNGSLIDLREQVDVGEDAGLTEDVQIPKGQIK